MDSERLKLTVRGSMGSGLVELHGAEDDLLQVASGDAAVVSNRALVWTGMIDSGLNVGLNNFSISLSGLI